LHHFDEEGDHVVVVDPRSKNKQQQLKNCRWKNKES
jgi:hypothetical protein